MGRRKAQLDPAEKSALAALITQYEGNLSQMARALGSIGRDALALKLKAHGLDQAAAKARAKGAVPGPREGAAEPDQGKILRLVAKHGYRAAAAELGVSPRTMARRMRAAGVTGEMIKAARAAR